MNIITFSVVFFVLVVFLSHLIVPRSYHWEKETISDLAARSNKHKWMMQLGFLGFGFLLTIGMIIRLINNLNYPDFFVLFYAVAIFLSGIFCTNVFSEAKKSLDFQAKMHKLFAYIAGCFFSFSIVAYIFVSTNYLAVLFHVSFLFCFLLVAVLFHLSELNIIKIPKGILQRFLYGIGLVWLTIVYL
ncbi:MAG: DUF998 domain-containing protein [Parachlamydiales bacterium]|nr:DUF998 domain-containing protein [Parachlamydiales bacterium]